MSVHQKGTAREQKRREKRKSERTANREKSREILLSNKEKTRKRKESRKFNPKDKQELQDIRAIRQGKRPKLLEEHKDISYFRKRKMAEKLQDERDLLKKSSLIKAGEAIETSELTQEEKDKREIADEKRRLGIKSTAKEEFEKEMVAGLEPTQRDKLEAEGKSLDQYNRIKESKGGLSMAKDYLELSDEEFMMKHGEGGGAIPITAEDLEIFAGLGGLGMKGLKKGLKFLADDLSNAVSLEKNMLLKTDMLAGLESGAIKFGDEAGIKLWKKNWDKKWLGRMELRKKTSLDKVKLKLEILGEKPNNKVMKDIEMVTSDKLFGLSKKTIKIAGGTSLFLSTMGYQGMIFWGSADNIANTASMGSKALLDSVIFTKTPLDDDDFEHIANEKERILNDIELAKNSMRSISWINPISAFAFRKYFERMLDTAEGNIMANFRTLDDNLRVMRGRQQPEPTEQPIEEETTDL